MYILSQMIGTVFIAKNAFTFLFFFPQLVLSIHQSFLRASFGIFDRKARQVQRP